jgi:phosphonate transport system substrate-binding protein
MRASLKTKLPTVAAASRLAIQRISLCLLLVLFCAPPVWAAPKHDENTSKVFRSGFLQSVFTNTDIRDARAVLEVYSREIARELKLNVVANAVIFPSLKSMTDAIIKGELDLASIPSAEYLRIRDIAPLIPSFVGTNSNRGQGINYVIITRNGSNIRSFSDLKGKSILLPPAAMYEPGHIWLDVLLMKTRKGGRDTFFSQVKESPKMSKAIMGVFFRQADAAIVSRSGLEISQQLNPQLKTQLTVLAESPNLSDFVVCMLPSSSETFRHNLGKALTRLNESKSGQQLYTIFQTSGITPFKPAYLEGLENLLREHKRLKAKTSVRK